MANWQVFIADSDNLNRLAEITDHARGKQLKLSMNKAGSFDFNVPMSIADTEYLNILENCIILSRNNQVVWSGPIWTKTENFDEGKISISAVGWFQLLHKRFVTVGDLDYVTWNDGDIAFNLLHLANGQVAGGSPRTTHLSAGTNTSNRNISLKVSMWANIGEEIEKLTQSEGGFDFLVDPEYRALNLYAWDEYNDNGLVFGSNWGPDNSSGVVRTSSAEEIGNQYYVIGPDSTAEMTDTASVGIYGLHQQVVNINEADDPSILPVIAGAELAVNKDPRVIIEFTPRPPSENYDFPSVFEDFNIRDKVYLTAHKDNSTIEGQAVRVWGFTLDINENNIERVSSMQTAFQTG